MEKTLQQYLETLQIRNFSLATIRTRKTSIEVFLKWCLKERVQDIREVTTETLRSYLRELETRCTAFTIDTKLRSLQNYFKYLADTQTLLWDPAEHLEVPPLKNRLPKNILSESEVLALLKLPELHTSFGLRNRAIMEVLYSTAMRRSECARLNVFDVDFKSQLVRINQGKRRKDRLVPIGKKAVHFLKLYLEKVRPRWLPSPDCTLLFLTKMRKPLDPQMLNIIVRNYGRQLNLNKPVTTHSFRRAAATHMLRGGASPVYLQRILGHAHFRSLTPYVRVSAKDLKDMHRTKHPRERVRTCSSI